MTNAAWLPSLLELTEQALVEGLPGALRAACTAIAEDGFDGAAVYLSDGEALVRVAAAGTTTDALPMELATGSMPPVGSAVDLPDGAGIVIVAGGDGTEAVAVAELLAVAVGSAHRVACTRDVEAAVVDRLREQASLDDLTGALNRRAFFERLDDELTLARQRRSDGPVTLIMFDLDRFKAINDAHGHPAGDAALVAFTKVLEGNVRSSDAVGRVGGDEFALLLVGADDQDVERVLKRLLASLEPGIAPELGSVHASHGIARCPDDGSTRDELVAVADERLYTCKRERGV
ncbi:MAG: GGDEF domain-containing protein [Actinomycetota bacterium]|nr:GGDEF domain-containing protein [Actinomycetota bacterium]